MTVAWDDMRRARRKGHRCDRPDDLDTAYAFEIDWHGPGWTSSGPCLSGRYRCCDSTGATTYLTPCTVEVTGDQLAACRPSSLRSGMNWGVVRHPD